MGGTCSTYGIDENVYKILVGKPEWKSPRGRPVRKLKVSIIMYRK
jgi:hypothetical protein